MKILSRFILLGVVLAAGNLPAQAQRNYPGMPGLSGGLQVNSSFQTMIPLTQGITASDETKATEGARERLYEMASKECDVIGRVFKGACRLLSINVNSYVQDRGNGLRGIQINVNARFSVATTGAVLPFTP